MAESGERLLNPGEWPRSVIREGPGFMRFHVLPWEREETVALPCWGRVEGLETRAPLSLPPTSMPHTGEAGVGPGKERPARVPRCSLPAGVAD